MHRCLFNKSTPHLHPVEPFSLPTRLQPGTHLHSSQEFWLLMLSLSLTVRQHQIRPSLRTLHLPWIQRISLGLPMLVASYREDPYQPRCHHQRERLSLQTSLPQLFQFQSLPRSSWTASHTTFFLLCTGFIVSQHSLHFLPSNELP